MNDNKVFVIRMPPREPSEELLRVFKNYINNFSDDQMKDIIWMSIRELDAREEKARKRT